MRERGRLPWKPGRIRFLCSNSKLLSFTEAAKKRHKFFLRWLCSFTPSSLDRASRHDGRVLLIFFVGLRPRGYLLTLRAKLVWAHCFLDGCSFAKGWPFRNRFASDTGLCFCEMGSAAAVAHGVSVLNLSVLNIPLYALRYMHDTLLLSLTVKRYISW